MPTRNTVRTVASLAAALCVVTMFAGMAAAAPVDVSASLSGDADEESGEGEVAVESDEGEVNGNGYVDADSESQEVTVGAAGGGSAGEQGESGAVECTLPPAEDNPEEACEVQPPGDGELPDPGDSLPEGDVPVDGLSAL